MFSLKHMIITGLLVAGVSAPALFGGSATAATGCKITTERPNIGQAVMDGRNFTKEGNRVYIRVNLDGGKKCSQTVTLVSWQAPSASARPFDEQVLYRYTTKVLTPGSYRLSIKVPNCYYQVDLVRGTQPTQADGTPGYQGRMIHAAHGGTQACVAVPETPDEPEVPENPVTTTTSTSTNKPATLTKTGPGAIVAGVFGSLSAAGTAAHYFVRRKLLNA